ncbi:hypothetical protein [Christiangramia sediminis]|uniref:Uncharacterized protein n=1 Tax=Christiangramia sediminis TaxID=2881336 RepID=A0A9X1RUE7_9FLAO|nr:hypothetical protein [Christiangramia sediminis]MCB7480558.1 hypothetical protein [Christiangramia sediminis]
MLLIFSILATLLMTAFSYVCTMLTGNNFREPELLNQLINTSRIPLKAGKKSVLGWLLHLLIGFVFGVIMSLVWDFFELSSYLIFGLISGIIAGVLGILGWQVMFYLNPQPPDIDLNKFYAQLIVAHVIFSLSFIVLVVLSEG